MPSYALNQFADRDDFLCKQLLNLELGPQRTGAPSSAGEHQPPGTITSNQWVQSRDVSPSSPWSKVGFWSERAVSLVEGETAGLGWACGGPGSSSASFSSSASSVSSCAASSRYKTELCRTFTERGTCKYGSKCQFAHGAEELRGINRHPKYKTEPCRTFHSIGFCPYGIRCHFVHNNDDDDDVAAAHLRPQKPVGAKRPPLLKQSFSFAGFPSNPTPLEHTPFSQSSFLSSPPSSGTISDLLATAFPEFLPSHDSGCCSAEPTPTTSPVQPVPEAPERTFSSSLGTRSLSLTSLSDQEGRCGSSASSQSGSDLCSAQDAAARRLPIFSQLSVPDGFCTESGFSFFL